MLLDLQVVHYACPATDLNYFFFTSMTGDVRRRNTEAFLGSYYSAFSSIMEDGGQKVPFTQAQLLKIYKDKNLMGSIYSMILVLKRLAESDDAMEHSKDTDEDTEDQLGDMRKKAMALVETNPQMRHTFLSVFDEIMELGIIP